MRIASLLPAATEIVCALGLGDELVAVSDGCDWPPEVAARPVAALLGGDVCRLEEEALRAAAPDLILVGDVCPAVVGQGPAASLDRIRRLLPHATVVRLVPVTLEGIFNAVTTVGAMTEAEDEAVGLVELLRERLLALEERVEARRGAGRQPRRVVALDGLDPLRVAGRWVPEQIRRAGGWDVLGAEGEPSTLIRWTALREVDPEVLIVAPTGAHLDETVAAWRRLDAPDRSLELEAARRGAVFAVDSAYLERGGPRAVDGVALLAELLDPGEYVDLAPRGIWAQLGKGQR
ncbi:MAG: ABC transporter substrate-binding protein [Candidatus Limnocylindrales bacterium]